MIKNFKHKGLKEYFSLGSTAAINAAHSKKVGLILDLLDAANEIKDMGFPGSYLHPLKGKLAGFWSVRVSGNWRIIFRFHDGDAYDVNYIDYH